MLKHGAILGILILSWCGTAFAAGEDWITIAESSQKVYSYKESSFQVTTGQQNKSVAMVTGLTQEKYGTTSLIHQDYVSIQDCQSKQGNIVRIDMDGRLVSWTGFSFGADHIASKQAEFICGLYSKYLEKRASIPETPLEKLQREYQEASEKNPYEVGHGAVQRARLPQREDFLTDSFAPGPFVPTDVVANRPGEVRRARLRQREDNLTDSFARREAEEYQAALEATEAKREAEVEDWWRNILVALCLLGAILLGVSFRKSEKVKQ